METKKTWISKLLENTPASLTIKRKYGKTILELDKDCDVLLYMPQSKGCNGVIVFKQKE